MRGSREATGIATSFATPEQSQNGADAAQSSFLCQTIGTETHGPKPISAVPHVLDWRGHLLRDAIRAIGVCGCVALAYSPNNKRSFACSIHRAVQTEIVMVMAHADGLRLPAPGIP